MLETLLSVSSPPPPTLMYCCMRNEIECFPATWGKWKTLGKHSGTLTVWPQHPQYELWQVPSMFQDREHLGSQGAYSGLFKGAGIVQSCCEWQLEHSCRTRSTVADDRWRVYVFQGTFSSFSGICLWKHLVLNPYTVSRKKAKTGQRVPSGQPQAKVNGGNRRNKSVCTLFQHHVS